MKTEKKIHHIYKGYKQSKKKGVKIPQTMGKYQYIFSNSNGKISMINEIRDYNNAPSFWEIYCLEGELFEDCERFSTKEEAIEKVKEYLGVDELSEIIQEKINMINEDKNKNG